VQSKKWFFFERAKKGPPHSPAIADEASFLFVIIQTTESLSLGGAKLGKRAPRTSWLPETPIGCIARALLAFKGQAMLFVIEEHIPSTTSLRARQHKAPTTYPSLKQRVVKGTSQEGPPFVQFPIQSLATGPNSQRPHRVFGNARFVGNQRSARVAHCPYWRFRRHRVQVRPE